MASIALGRRLASRANAPRATLVAARSWPLICWIALVGVGAMLVQLLNEQQGGVGVPSPPLRAWFDPTAHLVLVVPVLFAMLVIVASARFGDRLAWRPFVGGAIGAAVVWAVALSTLRGVDRLVAPIRYPDEYRAVAQHVGGVSGFLAGFVGYVPGYPVHVAGHPPGPVLAEWVLGQVGLRSAWWVAALFILGGASAAGAVLVAAREVAGELWARGAAPFVVLAPAAIWVATSADALFAGVAAWGSALVIVATGRSDRRGDLAALVGGLLLGWTAFSSYGLVLVGLIPLAVAVRRRRVRPIVLAGLGGVAVGVSFALAGFSWIAGLVATRVRYFSGIASRRPYAVFVLANLSALAVVVGPATAVALRRLRAAGPWLLVWGALAAVALADLSGMSKGEVERIWLPFTPWILLAGAVFTVRDEGVPWSGSALRASATAWLALQAGTAIAIESLVRTPW